MNKPIYEPKGKAREYGEHAINIYTGCNHGCIYCYAPNVLHKTKEQFQEVQVREGIVEAVKDQLKRENIRGKLIHLCFTCDPYPAEIDTTPTREIIKAVKDAGNFVQILTKGGFRAERDFDLLDGRDWFGVTLTTQTDLIKYYEPNAASFGERIASLLRAHKKGIRTWVSLEPVIDPKTVYRTISTGFFIDLFKIGKLNYMKTDINWAEFGTEAERLCKYNGRNCYIKTDLREEMEKARLGV